MTTAALPVLPGITHCRCSPPRYIRLITGEWCRIWTVEGGREEHVKVSRREPNCRGCGMVVAAGKRAETANPSPAASDAL